MLPVPEIAPPDPEVEILPATTLPVAVTLPAMLKPVGVNTATLPTVDTEIVTLALAESIFKLLPPLTTLLTEVIMPVN